MHSRFRAADRKEHAAAVVSNDLPEAGRIVVATQVIEAGIDLDASLMVSDLAPYASMVQRFGRVNRYGERSNCRIYWVDRPLTARRKPWAEQIELKAKEREEVCAPYDVDRIGESALILEGLTSGSPADLPKLAQTPAPWRHVLRRADLLDLFDTSTDLDGNEIDISRFVRSDPDRDVYVVWRAWRGDVPPENLPEIDEGELCPAPIGDIDKIAAKVAWCWNLAAGKWTRPGPVYPGLTLLMHVKEGKYTKDYGWSPESRVAVTPLTKTDREIEANNADPNSFQRYRQSLADHTEQVYERAASVLTLARVALGSGSWTERVLRLRDDLGPFRLAYLEMLLRAADEEANARGAL
jgi:CRISPR-associated endonuclease/helicase Cas3